MWTGSQVVDFIGFQKNACERRERSAGPGARGSGGADRRSGRDGRGTAGGDELGAGTVVG